MDNSNPQTPPEIKESPYEKVLIILQLDDKEVEKIGKLSNKEELDQEIKDFFAGCIVCFLRDLIYFFLSHFCLFHTQRVYK